MTRRAGRKRFHKHQALISRQRVKRGLQWLLDEDRRPTAVTPSLLSSAPVAENSNLVSYLALIPIDTRKSATGNFHNRYTLATHVGLTDQRSFLSPIRSLATSARPLQSDYPSKSLNAGGTRSPSPRLYALVPKSRISKAAYNTLPLLLQ